MSNLEVSWEETVVKLAQEGNLRAVAFWLNRHLVAQGICAQATTNQPGQLTLQILCRQAPDRDRLVQFICHRLSQLNSPVIQFVHFKVQLVGSTELLWTHTAPLFPVSREPGGIGIAEQVKGKPDRPATVQPSQRQANSDQAVPIAVATPTASNVAVTDSVRPGSEPMSAEVASALASIASQFPEGVIVVQPPSPSPSTSPKAQPKTKAGKPPKPQSLKRKTAHWLKQSQQQVRQGSHQLRLSTERSIQWFQRQKPRKKALILGSSAIAAFLLGCGFELLRHQLTLYTAHSQNPEAAANGARYEGMVKTAIEQVPVVQLPAVNPDNSTISLLFSNAVTLTSSSRQSGIAAQQNADMVISSLNTPLSDLAESSTSSAASPAEIAPEATSSPILESPSPAGAIDFAAPNPAQSAETFGPFPENTDSPNAASPNAAAELPPINLPPLTLQQLQANRVNVINLASNQLMQSGGDTLTQTIKSLSQASIYPIGAGTSQQSARRPQIFTIKGKRIAYLGYSDVSLQTAGQSTAGLNTSVNAQVEADIKSIRDQVDWVIVSYHWNQNLRSYPEDWQIQITHAAIDHGADLVVGYHPTVTQGAEVYGGRAIIYSLGSMLDPYQAEDADPASQQYETFALKLNLQDQQMQLELLPVRVSGGQTEILNADTGASLLDYLKQASSLFRQPLRSPTTLDARIRLTLPAAPNSDQPFSAPFTTDPAPSP